MTRDRKKDTNDKNLKCLAQTSLFHNSIQLISTFNQTFFCQLVQCFSFFFMQFNSISQKKVWEELAIYLTTPRQLQNMNE